LKLIELLFYANSGLENLAAKKASNLRFKRKSEEKAKKMDEVVISEINILPIKPRNGLLAFVSLVLNNSFYIGSVAIHSKLSEPGYRLVYPEKILANGCKAGCFHPINHYVAKQIEEKITEAYEDLIKKVKRKVENGI